MDKEQMMQKLILDVKGCRDCDLHRTRNMPMVGDGSVDASVLVVGEAPGYYEDKTGRAFMGEAGKIFDQLLYSVGLERKDVYVTNVLKCHPPKNHDPKRSEIDACLMYLNRQISILRPRVIIPLGKFAAREIFSRYDISFTRIADVKGKVFKVETYYGEVFIVPQFHPAVACYHKESLPGMIEDFSVLKGLAGIQ